jgi:hypothetical protein
MSTGHVHKTALRGRRFRCSDCGARIHPDVNGANTSCSHGVHGVHGVYGVHGVHGVYGVYAKVHAATVKYLRPIGVAPPNTSEIARVSENLPLASGECQK